MKISRASRKMLETLPCLLWQTSGRENRKTKDRTVSVGGNGPAFLLIFRFAGKIYAELFKGTLVNLGEDNG